MGKSQKPTGPAYDELHNQYPEFAWMHEWLHPRRGSKKYSSGVKAAAMKLAVLAAAVTGALAVALSLRVHSTLKDVSATAADIHVQVESVREKDLERPFFYDLMLLDEQTKQGEGTLPGSDALLSLTDLRPDTEYELIYYILDEKGQRTEVGRFRFRTRGQSAKDGDPAGGEPGSTPRPVLMVEATPSLSPSPSAPQMLLEILTDSLADATEQTGYSAAIAINNTTGKAPSFTITGYPSGMSATGNTLHGAPAIGAHGSHSVTVTVKAGTLTATKTLSLLVNPAKLTIANGNLGTYYPGGTVSGAIKTNFTPPSGLTYGASCALGGGCNASTGAFTIPVPSDAALGEYSIALSAAGGGYSAAKTITFTVAAKPKPEPDPPETKDLVINYFVDRGVDVDHDVIAHIGPRYAITPNSAADIRIRIDAPIVTSSPLYDGLAPAPGADGTISADLNGAVTNIIGGQSSTATMTVNYTLEGVAKTKTATIQIDTAAIADGPPIRSGGGMITQFGRPYAGDFFLYESASYYQVVDNLTYPAVASRVGPDLFVTYSTSYLVETNLTLRLRYAMMRMQYSHPQSVGMRYLYHDYSYALS